MHCPNCGHAISSELKFCRSCGVKLSAAAIEFSEQVSDKPETADARSYFKLAQFVAFWTIGIVSLIIGSLILANTTPGTPGSHLSLLLAALGLITAVVGGIIVPFVRAIRKKRPTVKSNTIKAVAEIATPVSVDKAPLLESGDDFRPVASVTESTTRELDKGKTKVFR